MSLNEQERQQLLAIAKYSIQQGLVTGQPGTVNLADYSEALNALRATFVTLELDAQLRGCIGMLEAIRPLALDVAENAFSAAFQDRRFSPLAPREMDHLALHISILSPAELMHFNSEVDLLMQLQPQVDGLILVEGGRRATFLPSVWETLSDPVEFLMQLKRKAGLPSQYWSDSIKAYRYTTDIIH